MTVHTISLAELQARVARDLEDVRARWPATRNPAPPVPVSGSGRFPTGGEVHRAFQELVIRKAATGSVLLRPAPSQAGLAGPVRGQGACLAPAIPSGARLWFDPRRPARDGDLVCIGWTAEKIQATFRDRGGDPEWRAMYAGQGAIVFKLLRVFHGRYWLVWQEGARPLNHEFPDLILGPVLFIDEPRARVAGAVRSAIGAA